MKFFKSEGPLFRKNILKHRLIFAKLLTYYNMWHQSINGSAIEILIKIKPEKALKLNSLDLFLK